MLSCAVVGCGPAGMAAALALRRAGLLVTCFEVAPEAGGIWACDPNTTHTSRGILSPIHPSLRCVVPKDLMSFSDMRFDMQTPTLPHFSAVKNYLSNYADSKGVNAITRFNTKVESLRYDEKTRCWKLISVGIHSGDVFEWVFDRVVVATGQCNAPRYPAEVELLRTFEKDHDGTVSHGCFLTNSRQYSGKKVVVVGGGASAQETCQRLYHIGANVTHCTREVPSEVVPSTTWVGGAPPAPASASALAERILSLWGTDSKRAEKFIRTLMATRLHDGVDVPKVGILRRVEGRDLYFAAASKPKLSISDHLDELERGGVRGTVPKVDESDDVGEVVTDVDAVFFATGYQYRMPFLPDSMRSVLEPAAVRRLTAGGKHREIGSEEGALAQRYTDDRGLLLGCIWKDVPTIAFVGLPTGMFPPFMMMEAQSDFVAQVFAGRRRLSPEMMRSLNETLVGENPVVGSLFNDSGLGLASMKYYDLLRSEARLRTGVPVLRPPDAFTEALGRRKWWFASTWVVSLIARVRSLAPLKRKKQHVLISNDI